MRASSPEPGAIRRWLDRHDPDGVALHRAIRLAIVLPVGLALTLGLGLDSQTAVFTAFGSVALLLFAELPGTRAARAGAYALIGLVGSLLIVIGTLAANVAWLAVLSTVLIGFLITFSGVISAAAAGATRALLLAYILPVTVPGPASGIPDRLLGWVLALVFAVPAALWLLPPRYHDRIRSRAVDACRALARELRTGPWADEDTIRSTPAAGDVRAAADTAVADFQRAFRTAASRPVGLGTGSRTLTQLADQLDWIRAVAGRLPAPTADLSGAARLLPSACADLLDAAAGAIGTGGRGPSAATRAALEDALGTLILRRTAAVDAVTVPTDLSDRRQQTAAALHEVVYATEQAARTVSAAAAADARPTWARILGRRVDPATAPFDDGVLAETQAVLSRRATLSSVWLQNSVRTAAGLGVAVLIVQLTHVSHSFWVGLGALSVLRTTAIGTGANALRALVGTTIGFVVGALLVLVLGTSPAVLWPLLPVMCLLAAFVPAAISFLAGQAAFTALVLIMFNLIDPVGWKVGLVRIEDVALGCLAGVVAGVLLWPRGAATQIRRALAECFRSSGDALVQATRHAVEPSPGSAAATTRARTLALAAAGRLDDAFRSYLAEPGNSGVPVPELTGATNAAGRIRQAADAISGTRTGAPVRSERQADGADEESVGVSLLETTAAVGSWFRSASDCLDAAGLLPPAAQPVRAEQIVVDDRRSVPQRDPHELRALWSIALHVDGVARCEPRLVEVLPALAPPAAPRKMFGQ